MDCLMNYAKAVSELPQIILEKENLNIEKAAKFMADTYEKGGLIHIFGTGAHSSIAGEEFFLRPGSLMNINPIFDPGLSVTHGAYRSWMIEKLNGYATPVLDYYKINQGDVMIIVNAYGINSVTIEAAIESKRKGATVIAVTSKDFALSVSRDYPSRHYSQKCLHELKEVDLVIDSHVPAGDCVSEIPGIEQKLGAVSTICNCIVLGLLNTAAVKLLIDMGIEPDMIKSPYYIKDANTNNSNMINKYYEIIRHI